jgi:hypothetical protein
VPGLLPKTLGPLLGFSQIAWEEEIRGQEQLKIVLENLGNFTLLYISPGNVTRSNEHALLLEFSRQC